MYQLVRKKFLVGADPPLTTVIISIVVSGGSAPTRVGAENFPHQLKNVFKDYLSLAVFTDACGFQISP